MMNRVQQRGDGRAIDVSTSDDDFPVVWPVLSWNFFGTRPGSEAEDPRLDPVVEPLNAILPDVSAYPWISPGLVFVISNSSNANVSVKTSTGTVLATLTTNKVAQVGLVDRTGTGTWVVRETSANTATQPPPFIGFVYESDAGSTATYSDVTRTWTARTGPGGTITTSSPQAVAGLSSGAAHVLDSPSSLSTDAGKYVVDTWTLFGTLTVTASTAPGGTASFNLSSKLQVIGTAAGVEYTPSTQTLAQITVGTVASTSQTAAAEMRAAGVGYFGNTPASSFSDFVWSSFTLSGGAVATLTAAPTMLFGRSQGSPSQYTGPGVLEGADQNKLMLMGLNATLQPAASYSVAGTSWTTETSPIMSHAGPGAIPIDSFRGIFPADDGETVEWNWTSSSWATTGTGGWTKVIRNSATQMPAS